MNINDLFDRLPGALNADAAAGLDAVIQFNTSEPRYVHIKDGAATVTPGTSESPKVAITMADDDFVSLMSGTLDGMTAFMTGKLKVEGDLMFAQKVSQLFKGSKLKDG
ncbi:MAG: SCP2 sterol-binding domain-containing protein [Pseudomonadota bacterium]